MTGKEINELTGDEAVSGTDSVPMQTAGGTTGRHTVEELATYIGSDLVTEENVTAALDGATLDDVGTPASGDLILLQDVSDSSILKVVSVDDLPGAGGGDSWGDAVDADIVATGADSTYDLGTSTDRFAEAHIDEVNTAVIDIDTGVSNPSHAEGLLFYDDTDKSLSYYNEESDVTVNIGKESLIRVYNDTGSTITNGTACHISGYDSGTNLPEASPTDTSGSDSVRFAGMATHDIENGSAGYITNFGRVNDLNTSSFTAGDTLYLSGASGGLTATRPTAPEYVMPVGVVVNSHASTGSIFVGATSIHGGNARLSEAFWNGSVVEDVSFTVSSNGTVITASLEADGGGDLTLLMDETRQTLDCTPAATVTLTAGTDASPQINYVYVPASTDTLTASTSGFPSAEHVPVGTVLCQSAASLQTDGAYKIHGWNDHLSDSSAQGHLSHLNAWIRLQSATWSSGVAVTPTVGASTFDVATSAGVVYQLHDQTFPAFDTSSGSEIYVVNDPDTAYTKVANLTQAAGVDKDANGNTLGGGSTDFYNLVLWGVASGVESDCKLMCNLPTGAYGNDNGSQASNDDNNTAVYAIPQEFRGTGFLIARLTVRENSGTYTIENNVDLRGQVPGLQGGQGSFGGSQFADNVFRIQDNGDVTKELAFEVSGITTATTRTVTVPDKDVDLTQVRGSHTESVSVPDPTDSDDVTLFFTPEAITVTAVHSHITAGTNVVFNIGHASTRTGTQLDVFTSDITQTSTSGATNNSGFNDASIPANSWVWLDIVSVSGSVTQFHATVEYTLD